MFVRRMGLVKRVVRKRGTLGELLSRHFPSMAQCFTRLSVPVDPAIDEDSEESQAAQLAEPEQHFGTVLELGRDESTGKQKSRGNRSREEVMGKTYI